MINYPIDIRCEKCKTNEYIEIECIKCGDKASSIYNQISLINYIKYGILNGINTFAILFISSIIFALTHNERAEDVWQIIYFIILLIIVSILQLIINNEINKYLIRRKLRNRLKKGI